MTGHEMRFLATEVKAGLALAQSVHHILDWLEQLCGKHTFRKLFGLILGDRKSEFDDVAGIEKDGRCNVYYTDPQRPDQKGSCEKNHVELRKVIPKGTSIDSLGPTREFWQASARTQTPACVYRLATRPPWRARWLRCRHPCSRASALSSWRQAKSRRDRS